MTLRSEPVSMWFDRRLALRKSPIHGIGTFALEAIQAGESLLWVTGGLFYTLEDWQAGRVPLEAELYNEEYLPDGTRLATPKVYHYYINHSSDPNSVDLSRYPTSTQYVALRDIAAGEEITANYM